MLATKAIEKIMRTMGGLLLKKIVGAKWSLFKDDTLPSSKGIGSMNKENQAKAWPTAQNR